MSKWKSCKRKDFIKRLENYGFSSPEPGGRYFYMRYETYTLTLPSNKEYSIPQIKRLLIEMDHEVGKKFSLRRMGKSLKA
ncbi:MAG TPA: type II toxin-antitoxin system HicA family toxin [Spirochaetes bacterium]|nr:type II toxin-antitoxin system HicA family toxin [Spirochaetota bacterium]